MASFTFYKQLNKMDCGPTCLKMLARFYGRHISLEKIRKVAGFNKEGVSMFGIAKAAEMIGFQTEGVQLTYQQLVSEAQLPAIIHWNQNHFVIVLSHSRHFLGKKEFITIADPASRINKISKESFLKNWGSSENDEGVPTGNTLLLHPGPGFYDPKDEKERGIDLKFVLQYLSNNKWPLFQVFFALFLTSLFQLVLPFLTQMLVDTGINTKNIHFITVILVAQLMLIVSRTAVDYIRSQLLLLVSSTINLSLLSDFWIKLTKLPIAYFDAIHTGDTMQRIGDNKQVQNFLTGSAISTIFSVFNFLIFSIILLNYNPSLFLVFIIGTVAYFIWVKRFLSIRRKLNYENFHLSAKENNATLQLVQGMQELKLHNAEKSKRWEWEDIQAGLFRLSFKKLSYSQIQQSGALLISQGKDMVITFMVAKLVVNGSLTFGAMLAIQFIMGQLSSPVEQLISFIQAGQDAKISLERLNEIHQMSDEDDQSRTYVDSLDQHAGIRFSNLSFSYPGIGNSPVLKNIELLIPAGKTTAIVGVSGSGKTTLLKILLKYFDEYQGKISIGETDLADYSAAFWRQQCGAVLQDGYIFNDTIEANITIGDESVDKERLINACRSANILSFIESLANGMETKLGSDGTSLSQGQKQRLLIARVVYKNPKFIFFDEATNALDANNEKVIVDNLNGFFVDKTVVVVAHRLSTVKNADQIVVLNEGEIVEAGSHQELVAMKGSYWELVKNQLELGT